MITYNKDDIRTWPGTFVDFGLAVWFLASDGHWVHLCEDTIAYLPYPDDRGIDTPQLTINGQRTNVDVLCELVASHWVRVRPNPYLPAAPEQ